MNRNALGDFDIFRVLRHTQALGGTVIQSMQTVVNYTYTAQGVCLTSLSGLLSCVLSGLSKTMQL